MVRHDCGDNSYIVEDGVGDLEKIWREDIITDQDDVHQSVQVGACTGCGTVTGYGLRGYNERPSEDLEGRHHH